MFFLVLQSFLKYFSQKTPELTYTKIMQIPHHICKPILNLNCLNYKVYTFLDIKIQCIYFKT